MTQLLAADITQEVSDALLEPMSESPYDDLKRAILDRTKPTTAERMIRLLAQHTCSVVW